MGRPRDGDAPATHRLTTGKEPMRILLVEDDRRTADFVQNGLRQEGFAVDHARDGQEGLLLAAMGPYDAAIIDIMLPKLDGLQLIERLRGRGISTPVVILSARSSVDDRIRGLHSGGDDYLVKPFSFAELVARLEALIRRAGTTAASRTVLVLGDLTVDLVKHRVARGGRKIELQPKEFALLEYLLRNTGRVLSKTMILEHVWDYAFDPQTNVVEVQICHLRDKIDREFEHKLIHTIRGVGYVAEVRK